MCDPKNKSMSEDADPKEDWDTLVSRVTPIAQPLASRKLNKKILKLVKKAFAEKSVCYGTKQIQKAFRKGKRGLVVLAGDVTPIDILVHLPGVCEDLDIPYCYTPSRMLFGASMGKRCVTSAIILPKEGFQGLYDEVMTEVKSLPLPI